MGQRLDQWCELANATGLAPMKRFVAMLQRHRTGLCNYAAHPITTARLEGGHVAIGLIRKRARGLLDTEYFKLKIRQSAVLEPPLGLYVRSGWMIDANDVTRANQRPRRHRYHHAPEGRRS
ncbi:transposase [Salinisphaera sp. SWV1]|uniref:transposase n=1 Tax=Salinisphaera sp. SWV1 TaxID=3454139 RepID=UPI003F86835E